MILCKLTTRIRANSAETICSCFIFFPTTHWPSFVFLWAFAMSHKSLALKMRYRLLDHSHLCWATWPIWTSVISKSFVAVFDDTLPTATIRRKKSWNTRRGPAVSRFTACAFAGLLDFKRMSFFFALQGSNVPRSGLYIMSRYEKTVSGVEAHVINTYWPLWVHSGLPACTELWRTRWEGKKNKRKNNVRLTASFRLGLIFKVLV